MLYPRVAIRSFARSNAVATLTKGIFAATKEAAKHVVTDYAAERVRRFQYFHDVAEARNALLFAREGDELLAEEEFRDLNRLYPVMFTTSTVRPMPDQNRALKVLKALDTSNRRHEPKNFVEVGAGNGHVAWAVANAGHHITCVDLRDEITPEAHEAGVTSITADACDLPLPENSIDGVWSFNCFEHIQNPEAALKEFHRIVRPGGRIYLDFAPLYNAALGLHAFLEIGVPFAQHLWSDDFLIPRVTSKDLWFLNRWSLANYRQLWSEFSERLSPIIYFEGSDFRGLELIKKYPQCFIKQSRNLDEFLTSKISVIFEVK